MKIAIVGSGVSGLVSAYLLSKDHHVTLFESEDRIGGHTNTVDVELDGERYGVDTGFIVFNEKTYPNFCRLLDRLDVPSQPSDMSFSVTCERSGQEYATHSARGLFARRRNLFDPRFHRMIREILRFNRECTSARGLGSDLTLADYLEAGGFSKRFVDLYIVPMGAAIWSADPERFLNFPALTFIRFFENHGLLDHKNPLTWRVVRGGSKSYVDALLKRTRAEVHTSCPVLSARRHSDAVELLLPDGVRARFDHVIFACHSDQALSLLEDRSDMESSILGDIEYQPNETALHSDATVMPSRTDAWASWNYRIPASSQGSVTVTYDMNRLQGIRSDKPLLVTLNCNARIDPSKVLRRFTYHHPVYTTRTVRAQKRRSAIDGTSRTHFCGAYWGHGFHEDGVKSALDVCERFGVSM
jgi:predicted NAD/FAD-binding protein